MLTHQWLKRHQLWHFGATQDFLYWPDILHFRQSLFRDIADSAISQTRFWIIAQQLTSTMRHLSSTCDPHAAGQHNSRAGNIPFEGQHVIAEYCCTTAILNVCYQTSRVRAWKLSVRSLPCYASAPASLVQQQWGQGKAASGVCSSLPPKAILYV